MANEFRPLIEILRDLKALALQKASGFFFVVTEDNHSCTIRLRSGQIEDVVFSRHRSDEAVQLLAKVPAGRARFQADPAAAGAARVSLGEASLSWLMGGFEKSAATAAATPAAPRVGAVNVNVQGLSKEQRATIERIALNYLGPIAALLCDEALGVPGSIDRALVQIASNLPARDQEDQFLAEARAALGLRG
ncbi:MAG: hypothetical protein ACTHNM_09795 [Dyella sp.]|uniref:hypothetical protein n=1 Tax=Dyella sp. TaxID=1869338 RepID=UPI003F7F9173